MNESAQKTRSKKLFKQHTELEILVSAAIVFAAINFQDAVIDFTNQLLNGNFAGNSYWLGILTLLGLIAATIFPISIITHLILRSYWLALVGLKLAFEKEPGKPLNFDPIYDKEISKHLDLDLQIKKMDKLTSSVFSFSFLTLFSFLFSLIFLLTFVNVINALSGFLGDSTFTDAILITLMVGLLTTGPLYAIDFFGLGILKKIKRKWFQRIYYPIYRFYSVITVAKLYRGIYYTLLTQVNKKVIATILPLYVLVTLTIINLGYNSYLYYPPTYIFSRELGKMSYVQNRYKDELTSRLVITGPMIQSRYISENHIRLFIPLSLALEDSITNNCDNLRPFDQRGLHWKEHFTISGITEEEGPTDLENAQNILDCISSNIQVSINDSTYANLEYRYSDIYRPARAGVEAVFSIRGIGTGNHIIKVQSEEFYGENHYEIPFWKD